MVFPRATCVLVGPRRRLIVAITRDLTQVLSVMTDGVDLGATASSRGERNMPSVGRVRRAFVRAFSKRDPFRLTGAEVVHLDVEPGAAGACRERDLVERATPGGAVGF